jgi:hypothetical protein
MITVQLDRCSYSNRHASHPNQATGFGSGSVEVVSNPGFCRALSEERKYRMFARMVEIAYKLDKKDELINTVRQEILPILKKQAGFLELLPLVPEVASEHMFAITLWADKRDVEKYDVGAFPRVEQVLKPFLTIPLTVKTYTVETSVCQHVVDALTQAA